ncbi:hypothetical protein SOCE26_099880 [Sorangium cellulosum]|uniref:DUF2750 domain-containing protein n=1 Tax=Sorangium cellulosum TaxID=56 RepID=A0A2L0FA67_SORCE|nr:DUF2750 domain-containing protein [Sorangium cellulosum]AUX48454.1 hypothetical protein SOCE26_099880 [Sorangium cellulosum]
MKKTTEKEIQAVLVLDGPARYRHFVKTVVAWETAWGLWKDGWVLMANDEGVPVFPLWPAREYAELHRTGDWANHEAEEVSLDRLLGELLPMLAARGMLAGVFPTPAGQGVTLSAEELTDSLRKELMNYE